MSLEMIDDSLIKKTLASPVQLDEYLLSVAERYPSHRFLGGATQACYLRMIKLLAESFLLQGRNLASIRVLDWGSGKGHITYLLKSAGFDVVSCDIESSDKDSSFGQQTPILDEQNIQVVSLTHPWRLPFDNAEFDLIVSFGVLEHVANDFESLEEIHRILKPGGIFFFSFLPYWLSWSQRIAHMRGDMYHSRLYRKKELIKMAEGAGFVVDAVWHGQLFPKNSLPHSGLIERVDRALTWYTPLKYFATNLEGLLIAG